MRSSSASSTALASEYTPCRAWLRLSTGSCVAIRTWIEHQARMPRREHRHGVLLMQPGTDHSIGMVLLQGTLDWGGWKQAKSRTCEADQQNGPDVVPRPEAVEQVTRDFGPRQQRIHQQEHRHRQLDAPVVGDRLRDISSIFRSLCCTSHVCMCASMLRFSSAHVCLRGGMQEVSAMRHQAFLRE